MNILFIGSGGRECAIARKTKGNLYIGLITDASFMTPRKNTEKVINKFLKNYDLINF